MAKKQSGQWVPIDALDQGVNDKPADARQPAETGSRLYTIDVTFADYGYGKAFKRLNKKVLRSIQIRGDQMLADLHEAIFRAFDRFDEHLYEFQLGKGPRDREGKVYRPSMAMDGHTMKNAEETTIDSLKLRVGRVFGYRFDFGDEWRHHLEVTAIDAAVVGETYPMISKRVGESPPQYPDMDEED